MLTKKRHSLYTVGSKLFEDSVAAGKIIEANTIDLQKIENEALRKKIQISTLNEQILSAMKLFNVSDIDIKTYTTLASLGYTNISMLNRVMKYQESEIML